jgi:hypothetical protein
MAEIGINLDIESAFLLHMLVIENEISVLPGLNT